MKIAAFYENILDGARNDGIAVAQAVESLKRDGLELLYISSWTLERDREELEEVLKSTGLGVEGLYGIYDFGKDLEDKSYEILIREAKRLGASNVLLVPGMVEKDEEDQRKLLIGNMEEALKRAVAFGREYQIAVSMEDFDGMSAPYCTISGLDNFFRAVPGLLCSFDTGNFILYGEDELAAFETFKDRLCTVHLKDRSHEPFRPEAGYKVCADGTKSYACPVGSGYIAIGEILHRLRKQRYQGNVIVELYDYHPKDMLDGIRQSLSWVRNYLDMYAS